MMAFKNSKAEWLNHLAFDIIYFASGYGGCLQDINFFGITISKIWYNNIVRSDNEKETHIRQTRNH